MITWTESARNELERHVAAVRTRMIAVGADANEVSEDIERHVSEELTAQKIAVATPEDVRRVLARMGTIEAELVGVQDAGSGRNGDSPEEKNSSLVTFFCIALGVVLPVVALVFEFITRACSSEMFDPMPTLFHALMIALVPLANGLALYHAGRCASEGGRDAVIPRWLGLLNGAAVAVAALYAAMFALITPFAVLAVIFFGIGLLPLAPLMALITALICRTRLRRAQKTAGQAMHGWRAGVVIALLALVGLETPSILTEAGLRLARSERTETMQRGLHLLRAVGSEERLLQRCYPRNGAAMDLVGFVFSFGKHLPVEEARTIFYRVTGKPFNLVPMPERFGFGGRSRMSDDWVWDSNAGGEVVGQRLKGLALTESRIDGTVDADALTGYLEWTMVFKNTAGWQQEARAQIALPPGGVVSRLTLWVNGEEREAAFAGRSQVREAYQKVAIQQRRDPVLVTTKGPNRVQMQCFPVPANGEMKIRFGVTMPLRAISEGKAEMMLPRIIEQNFSVPDGVTHALWLESASPLALADGGLKPVRETNGLWSAHGAIALKNGEVLPLVMVSGNAERREHWAVHSQMPGKVFVQRLVEAERKAARELVVVIDGSQAMGPLIGEIADVIGAQDAAAKIRLLVAGDVVVSCPGRAPAEVAAWLRAQRFVGGQDNLDALSAAWDDAAAAGGEILWIHGTQPVGWQSFEGLSQKQTRRPKQVAIRAFAVVQGAQVILEKLDGVTRVTAAERWGTLREDLSAELGRALTGGGRNLERTMSDRTTPNLTLEQQEKGGHIARLWAADEIARLVAGGKRAEAVALAGKFQLVTAVSGAVVLETKAQFDAAGLAAIDPATAPSIPEPATVVLIMGGAAAVFVVWRKRKLRRAA
ncbi:hypothetical protein CMV30_18915 [Nibricoccus aquaticus]|uniref:VIT domain-containing protein n=1 Tax=Nibricoccus aquaticus TaxID=2576891 RepID=A0A290QP41_9BACT|nr:VIT domain-containing protein [Nibricoccus aquaticus]ATC66242.1 hypothetical protein CMV30_18915 [Nibricoccus aquaticus]